MELKRLKKALKDDWFELLIVPYGIETTEFPVEFVGDRLLIVPYGIETLEKGIKCGLIRRF